MTSGNVKMASPPEEPPKLSLNSIKLEVETTFETKITVDNFFERRKRAMEMRTEEEEDYEAAESIFSDVVTLHSVDGHTYRINFEVQLRYDVS